VLVSTSQRIRIGFAVLAAATVYYYLLVYSVGYLTAMPWPTCWIGIFPSKLIAVRVWLFVMHTCAILLSAAPVALLVRLLIPAHRVLICVCAAVVALVAANLPLHLDLLAMSLAQHPILWVMDVLKVLLALPFLAWAFRLAPSNPSLERP
jgi:hypothetical protein